MKFLFTFIVCIGALLSNEGITPQNTNLSGLCVHGNDISIFFKAKNIHSHSPTIQKIQEYNPELYDYIKTNVMWHLKVPTTGFYADKSSSYIPYWFSLWDLAPKKGDGITVALLDTGVATFERAPTKSLTKHPNILFVGFDPYENYNCCAKGLQAFINYLVTFLKPNKIPSEREVIPIVIEYCATRKTDALYTFLRNYGKANLFNAKGVLTEFGTLAIQELTQGRRGILPHGKVRFFTLIGLMHPVRHNAIYEFLPMPTFSSDLKNKCTAAHGTHLYGLINAQENTAIPGFCGIAPRAQTLMLKVCNEAGTSDVETILYALKKAQSFNADIVNLSLKIQRTKNSELCKLLEDQLRLPLFVVAASGNDQLFEQSGEAYPAHLESIAFDVGAFLYDGTQYHICPFSQYEKDIGPKFVAPGFNLLSTGIPSFQGDFLFLSGTSMATALMSGFLALMLAEFKEDFTREQLLKVCYSSTKRLSSDSDWQDKCLLGALDMRTVLFTLHIAKSLKEKVKYTIFRQKFDVYVKAIQIVMQELEFSVEQRLKLACNLAKTVDFFVTYIQNAEKSSSQKNSNNALLYKIQSILTQNDVDLFSACDRNVRKRLLSSLYPR